MEMVGGDNAWRSLNALAVSGRPVIDKVFGFDEVPQALQHLEKGPFGKIVISTT